ncbi:aldo/keto reductase family oxidoreductase [Sphingomonas sp. SUN039]|uniref:aldo/keto reductase n=1 Tax=Sphingomonas sp. SUN039 TaxID=2937787 RepID=UPI0021645C23|nr:aldo/keto reductase [Sphingomonas sp. SUN039]UVO53929.1 aldo/keto reductase [Sphingomonas sp. SUN039]
MSTLPPVPATRLLGKSGIVVSSMAWGMWRFAGRSVAEARTLVEAALDSGITLLDTADIYGFDGKGGFGNAEALLGQVFAEAPALRDRMVLATKGGIMPPLPYDSSPAYLDTALDASLKRMGVHRVDLYQIHRPDILTHPHEIAKFAEKAYALGKIGAFGVSNMTVAQTAALLAFMPRDLPLSTIQPELSPLCLDAITDGTLDLALQHNLAPMAWSPLGGGRIASPTDARATAVAAALDAVAQTHGVSRTAATYSWIMAHPARPIPIVGSQQVDRIREAADAYKVTWTREDWYKVLVASRGEKLP